jgi:Tfp pilus assembly protein PilE
MMKKSNQGLGLIELVIALAIITGITYLILKRQTAPAISESTLKKMKAQGVALPAGMASSQPQQLEDAVQNQLNEAAKLHEKNTECSINQDAKDCSVTPAR